MQKTLDCQSVRIDGVYIVWVSMFRTIWGGERASILSLQKVTVDANFHTD